MKYHLEQSIKALFGKFFKGRLLMAGTIQSLQTGDILSPVLPEL